jgi:hypothetical protein
MIRMPPSIGMERTRNVKGDGCPAVPLEAGTRLSARSDSPIMSRGGDATVRSGGLQVGVHLIKTSGLPCIELDGRGIGIFSMPVPLLLSDHVPARGAALA